MGTIIWLKYTKYSVFQILQICLPGPDRNRTSKFLKGQIIYPESDHSQLSITLHINKQIPYTYNTLIFTHTVYLRPDLHAPISLCPIFLSR